MTHIVVLGPTMSTREIAELTGKQHRNVLRDARNMLAALHGEGNLLSFEHLNQDRRGRSYEELRLPYRETMILVSGYNIQMRAKIIDRWQELEQATKAPILNLNDPASLRTALLGYTEKVLELEATVAEQVPKVEGFECIANSSGAMTIRAAAKAAQMKEM